MIGRRLLASMARVRPSRIGARLLAFNLLLVFLPVAGILYLDVYEAQLLDAQERSMVQQARVLAAALGDRETMDPDAAQALIARIGGRGDARLRVYDPSAAVVADSARVRAPDPRDEAIGRYAAAPPSDRDRLLYRVGAWIAAARRGVAREAGRIASMPVGRTPIEPQADPHAAPSEVSAALRGRYGAATRPTAGQRSLTLSSAVPVRHGDRVTGAVVVSQSTFRLLQALYAVRLRIFEVVVSSLIAAAVLSLMTSATLVRPIVRLRREAAALTERHSRLPGRFRAIDRRDEVGDLARALDELARRLDAHIRLLESFAADVSHEFKNPLAAIRTAAETIAQADSAADRQRFLDLLARDVDRLERLVSGVRELATIDAQLAQEPLAIVDVRALVSEMVERLRIAGPPRIELTMLGPAEGLRVRASADRLVQILDNVMQNARSFTPPDAAIAVALTAGDRVCRIEVADRGPGIPDAHLERIFDRFFTYRPSEAGSRREHAGLGLAIARTLVQGYGGTITAHNRPGGGACFELRLPSVLS